MNLNKEQEQFINLIEDNYNNYCDLKYQVTTEFLDLDKFKSDFTIFVSFDNLNFISKYDDDCTDYGKLNISCYLVLRNDKSENLNSKLLFSTDAFFEMLKNNNIEINSIDFYNYASGTKYIVASEFALIQNIEL